MIFTVIMLVPPLPTTKRFSYECYNLVKSLKYIVGS